MKTVAIVQARMGSTRLPGKVLREVLGRPLIELVLRRLARASRVDQVVLATSVDARDDPLADCVSQLGFSVVRGSEDDVLARYLQAAHAHGADVVVRITGDCPLIDPGVVDGVIGQFLADGADYTANSSPPTFPDGLDTEVFSFAALEQTAQLAMHAHEREHVTPFMRNSGRFRTTAYCHAQDLSTLRWTVDEEEDLAVITRVFAHFAPDLAFDWQQVVALQAAQPELFHANRHIRRNQGTTSGAGNQLWQRAKRVIPGGNMLLSKRAEMFLPDQWPSYFSKAKGCRVWDLDSREYIDLSIMGIGANTLGYGHPEVDQAVLETVRNGNMSTLNCPEEVYLAERLVALHPWAEMARLARTGGEANAIAIRIARAATGRDKVAICGYHGWHDWYLAANLADERHLDGHLLPGLEPRGVPRDLKGSVLPFSYNRLEELEALVAGHDIGAIKMEVSRNEEPAPGFLEGVRRLASDKGIVLIFDECTSGFRETFGGLHKKYGVAPDMAIFGKTLGNGYAITAILGRREVMEAAQTSFISSTFWTERIGPSAALKTLEVMERAQSWETITATGRVIQARWQALADRHGLRIKVFGLPALACFAFESPQALAYKTLITQEMLKRGYLAGTSVYACTEHTPALLDDYFAALDPVFGLIAECEAGRDPLALLNGPVCHSGFKRLN